MMKIDKNVSFGSERLRYRGIREEDADIISAWRSDSDNYAWFFEPHPISVDEHLTWFAGYLKDDSRLDLLISDEEGHPIGTGGLSSVGDDECEISYMIGEKSARKKGYAVEAIRALSDYAFSSLGADRIRARILPDNEASIRAIKRGGFSEKERRFELSKAAFLVNDKVRQ